MRCPSQIDQSGFWQSPTFVQCEIVTLIKAVGRVAPYRKVFRIFL